MHVLLERKDSLVARNQAFVHPVSVMPYFLVISYEFKIREKIINPKDKQHSDRSMEVHYTNVTKWTRFLNLLLPRPLSAGHEAV